LISKCPSLAVMYTVDSGRISYLERVAGDSFCHFSVISKYCTSFITFRLLHESSGRITTCWAKSFLTL